MHTMPLMARLLFDRKLMPLRVPTTDGGVAISLGLGKTVAPRNIDIRLTATLSWLVVRVTPAVAAQAGQAVAQADRPAGVVLRVEDWAVPRIPIRMKKVSMGAARHGRFRFIAAPEVERDA